MAYFKAPEGIVLEGMRKTTKSLWIACVPTEMKETHAEYTIQKCYSLRKFERLR
jgi:hypothetical protein